MRAAWLAGLMLLAGAAEARVLEVGQGKQYPSPSAAVAVAADGDTVSIAPGEYFDCASVKRNRLTIQGTGAEPGAVTLTDKTCEGKALIVASGADLTVRNLTLTRARVRDENGAGIRAEGNNLTVERVRFVNDQNGILGAPEPTSTVTVRDSVFERDGFCGSQCSHGIYVAALALLRLENTVFREIRDGHAVKSRATRTEVVHCVFEDGPEGTSSYLIELPNGGGLTVRDSKFEKGPKTGNQTAAIVIGTEGITQRTPEIVIENNTFTNDGDYATSFVWNLTATEAALRNNMFKGNVTALKGDGSTR